MYGSVLTLLVFHMLPETPEANLARIWQEIRAWYNRYLNKLSMFVRQSGFPKLRGKAAEIRYLAGPMLEVWRRRMNQGVQLHRRDSSCLV